MLINIQFLRFVAATLVVLYHAGIRVRAAGGEMHGLFGLGEAVGFAGVDVFFVISGFIMFHTTRERRGWRESGDFLRRRVARIYSGYWPFFALTVLLLLWIRPERLERVDLLASFTLWPSPARVLPVSWTLTYEMIFYLLFALLLLLAPGRRIRLLQAALVAVIAWSAWAHWGRGAFEPGVQEAMHLAEAWLASPYLAEFIAGALLGARLSRRPGGAGWTWLLAGTGLFLGGGWISHAWFGDAIEQGYTVVYRVTIFGTASVMILAGLVRLEQRGLRAPRRLSLALGGASYALYLCHTPILWTSTYLGLPAALAGQGGATVNLAYWVLVLGTLLYSYWHYRRIERPLHRAFKRALRLR